MGHILNQPRPRRIDKKKLAERKVQMDNQRAYQREMDFYQLYSDALAGLNKPVHNNTEEGRWNFAHIRSLLSPGSGTAKFSTATSEAGRL